MSQVAALHRYECGGCGASFEAPALPETAYGEFLLWSDGGLCAALKAVQCAEYAEANGMLADLDPDLGHDPNARAEALQTLFGPVVCDPAPDGTTFRIGLPPCPTCGQRELGMISPIEPVRRVHMQHVLTFDAWRANSLAEKSRAIFAFRDLQKSGVR